MMRFHAGLVPVACTVSLLSTIRPTMSKLRYAASWSTGTGGLFDERLRSDQSNFLSRPEPQEDVAAPRLFRQRLRHRQHRRRSRRVVVGAVVNAAGLVLARRASCRRRPVRGDRSARRSPPTAYRRRWVGSWPAGRRRRCVPVCGCRCTAALTVTVTLGIAKPDACGLPVSMPFWRVFELLSGAPAKIARPASPLMLAATMPEPASAGVERHRNRRAGIRRARSGRRTSSALAPR